MSAISTLTRDANNTPVQKSTGFTFNAANTVIATITNAELATNAAIITTSAAHGFLVGQSVTIALTALDPHYATFSFLNGTYAIVSNPDTTSFTFAKTHADVPSDTIAGTATEALASPIVTGTTDVTLVAPANAVALVIYLPDNPAKLKSGTNTITLPKTTLISIPVKSGSSITIARASTTALEFYFETV